MLVGTVCAIVLGTAAPVNSDTARVHCHLNVKSPVMKRTDSAANSQFSQSQGNVHLVMNTGLPGALQFFFPASK